MPGCEYFCAEALCCVSLCAAVVDEVAADGQDVADAAAADVAGVHTVLVAVETGSESTQQDAACGREARGPCTLGAIDPAAPSHLIKVSERGSIRFFCNNFISVYTEINQQCQIHLHKYLLIEIQAQIQCSYCNPAYTQGNAAGLLNQTEYSHILFHIRTDT